jgi:hypothetical protein
VLELGGVLEGVEGDDSIVVIGGEEHGGRVDFGSVDVVEWRVSSEKRIVSWRRRRRL